MIHKLNICITKLNRNCIQSRLERLQTDTNVLNSKITDIYLYHPMVNLFSYFLTATLGPVWLQLSDHVQSGHGGEAAGTGKPLPGGTRLHRPLPAARSQEAFDGSGTVGAQFLQGTSICD